MHCIMYVGLVHYIHVRLAAEAGDHCDEMVGKKRMSVCITVVGMHMHVCM